MASCFFPPRFWRRHHATGAVVSAPPAAFSTHAGFGARFEAETKLNVELGFENPTLGCLENPTLGKHNVGVSPVLPRADPVIGLFELAPMQAIDAEVQRHPSMAHQAAEGGPGVQSDDYYDTPVDFQCKP